MRNLQRTWQCSGSWILFLIICCLIFVLAVMILIAAYGRGNSAGTYPSVSELETQLQLIRGVKLPKMVVNQRTGEPFFVYYEAGKDYGNGHYAASILLKPAR